jgi:hypothetical protein
MSEFSSQQVKTLAKLLGRQPCEVPKGTPECFLLRYVFLEALIRLVGRYYRERSTTQKKAATEDSSLNVEVVKRSLKHFGVLVDERRVDGLLASPKAKRGQKTARVLRNGLVHRWDVSDAKEAVERFDELVTAMMELVDAIAMRVKGQTP